MGARVPAPVSSPASPPQGAGWSHADNIIMGLVVLACGGIAGWAADTQVEGLPAAFAMLVTFSAVAVAISREAIVEAVRAHPAGSRWRRMLVDDSAGLLVGATVGALAVAGFMLTPHTKMGTGLAVAGGLCLTGAVVCMVRAVFNSAGAVVGEGDTGSAPEATATGRGGVGGLDDSPVSVAEGRGSPGRGRCVLWAMGVAAAALCAATGWRTARRAMRWIRRH